MTDEYIVVHTGDNHLRDAQYGYPSRGEDFRKSLQYVVETTILRKAQGENIVGIMNAGDLLDNTRPSPATIKFLNHLHAILVRAKLSMFVISGNHDKTSPHWTDVIEMDPDGYGVVCADNKLVEVAMGDTIFRTFCMPFCSKDDFIHKLKFELPKQADAVMWHGAVQEFVKFPMETAIKLDEIPTGLVQCIFTGDIHINQVESLSDGTKVISPGSTEVCNSAEPLDKYTMDVKFKVVSGKPVLTDIVKVPVKTRKFLCYRLITEEDVDKAIEDVRNYADEGPVILIRSNQTLNNVSSRFNVVVDRNKCILKIGALPSTKMDAVNLTDKQDELVKAEDLLHIFIPTGTDLFELGMQMVNPEINEKDALEQYCNKFLGGVKL